MITITHYEVIQWLKRQPKRKWFSYYNQPQCLFAQFASFKLGKPMMVTASGGVFLEYQHSESGDAQAVVPFHSDFWKGLSSKITRQQAINKLTELYQATIPKTFYKVVRKTSTGFQSAIERIYTDQKKNVVTYPQNKWTYPTIGHKCLFVFSDLDSVKTFMKFRGEMFVFACEVKNPTQERPYVSYGGTPFDAHKEGSSWPSSTWFVDAVKLTKQVKIV
jgi:hypothetical protein